MSSGKVLLGLVAGLAAGAVIGMLFAPAKGKETRQKISQKGADVLDGLKEKFDEFLENISEMYQEEKKEATDSSEQFKPK